MASVARVTLLAHVLDAVGEATVRGALESVGAIGDRPGQISPHRQVAAYRRARKWEAGWGRGMALDVQSVFDDAVSCV